MNRLKLICLAFSAVLVMASTGFADSVTLRLVDAGPGTSDGAHFVYPYNFSVNGSDVLIPLICDDYNGEIYFGETWSANVYSMQDILQGNGQMSPSGGLVNDGNRDRSYEEAAWLYQQLLASPTASNAISINHTIWGIFTDTPYNANPDVMSWYSQAQDATSGLSASQAGSLFANVAFYTPIDGTQLPSSYGRPQELMGIRAVPEPWSVALLGTGLAGLIVIKRRKLGQPAAIPIGR